MVKSLAVNEKKTVGLELWKPTCRINGILIRFRRIVKPWGLLHEQFQLIHHFRNV